MQIHHDRAMSPAMRSLELRRKRKEKELAAMQRLVDYATETGNRQTRRIINILQI